MTQQDAPRERTPEENARLAKLFVLMTPPGALLGFVLTALQGGEWWICFLCASAMAIGCLGAAALVHLRGSKAGQDAAWISLILGLLARR